MNATLKLIQTSAKLQLRYKTAMIAGLITNIAWGIFRYYLVAAFYLQTTSINGFTKTSAATYVPLTQSLMVLLNIFGSMEINQLVHKGEMATILMRPMGFIKYWLAYYGGRSIVNLFLRSFLLLMIFNAFFPIQLPGSVLQWILFLVSICISWFLSHVWIITINLTAFWLTDATGVLRMVFALQQLLTGMLFPLRILPTWFQKVCYLTPFPSMLNIPIEIFTNTVTNQEALWLLLQQIMWLGLLAFIARLLYQAGLKRLEINGG